MHVRLADRSDAARHRGAVPSLDLGRGRRWFVLPIENNVRELDAKTLLAAAAAERGMGVLLARITDVTAMLGWLPPSVVLHKDVVGPGVMTAATAGGHVSVATDEEGLVQRDPADYLHRRVATSALESCTRFYAWGEEHRRVLLTKAPHLAERILVTGNPRVDLLRPGLRELYRPAAEAIQQRYGAFLLVNSNFGAANHRLGLDYVRRHWLAAGWSSGPGREGLLERIVALQSTLFDAFVAAIDVIAPRLPAGKSIVVRPHPSENHDTWRRRLGHHGNVLVVHEGPAVPWLLAADALLHNGCTTGIEATLLDRPVFAYEPVRDQAVESRLPNLVSTQVGTLEELVVRLAEQPLVRRESATTPLKEHIAGLTGELASDVIASDVSGLTTTEATLGSRIGLMSRVVGRRATVATRSYVSAAVRRRWSEQRRYDALLKQTSTGLRADDVDRVLRRLEASSGRFARVSCRAVAPDLVAVSEAS